VFKGPYRFTRNPMYVSVTAIQIGLGLAVGVLWISLLAPVTLATIHVTAVRREERYLSETFGRDYDDYRARARRYLSGERGIRSAFVGARPSANADWIADSTTGMPASRVFRHSERR